MTDPVVRSIFSPVILKWILANRTDSLFSFLVILLRKSKHLQIQDTVKWYRFDRERDEFVFFSPFIFPSERIANVIAPKLLELFNQARVKEIITVKSETRLSRIRCLRELNARGDYLFARNDKFTFQKFNLIK